MIDFCCKLVSGSSVCITIADYWIYLKIDIEINRSKKKKKCPVHFACQMSVSSGQY